MSIKLIAKDLYRLQKKVGQLEEALSAAPLNDRAVLEEKLRKARAEKAQLRRALDGKLQR